MIFFKIILFIIIMFSFTSKLKSEECILEGDSANQINKYNQCLVNQIDNSDSKYQVEINLLKDELAKLTKENLILKKKLGEIREILKNLFLRL